jgi:hypothetical protein
MFLLGQFSVKTLGRKGFFKLPPGEVHALEAQQLPEKKESQNQLRMH